MFVYDLSSALLWPMCKLWFRLSATGRDQVPRDGPVVLACNHASHLDPVLLGLMTPRRCCYVARSSLGGIPLVGWWMRAVGVLFIDRKAPGREAVGRAIAKLQEGGLIGMFPEGTRSRNGEVQAFQRGLLLLLKKTQARVVSVGIRGSFAALPPGGIMPRPRRCSVHFGRVWSAEEVLAPGGLEALRHEVAGLAGSAIATGDPSPAGSVQTK